MKYSFDLHMHSCLSPCGSDDNTPAVLAGMCAVSGISIAALTDHNSCKNCEVFLDACEKYGVLGLAGMELTTSEEVHVVCLFPDIASAESFDSYVYGHLPDIDNRPQYFGNQLIKDINDNTIAVEPRMLSTASSIGIYSVAGIVNELGGLAYPAHIDRTSNSLLNNLGLWDSTMGFPLAELSIDCNPDSLAERNDLKGVEFIKGSDAHYLHQIKTPFQYIELQSLSALELICVLKKL